MILDRYELPAEHSVHADVCIVGSGAAGITLALELIGSGIDVLLLEAGGTDFDEAAQRDYAGTVADTSLHSPPDTYRQRRFGGTTAIWGGRCMPFDAIDFEARDFVPHSGWPFALDTLLPYYPRANELCEAGPFLYTAAEALHTPLRPMIAGFDSAIFSTDTLERFSCPTDFARRYGHRLHAASNVRVLLHANVTGIQLDPHGASVTQLHATNLRGQRLHVSAQYVVLAAGGLEVPRLLLANRDVHPTGIGNRHDVVGRFYMCHLAGTIGRIRIDGPVQNAFHGYDVSDEGVYCRRRIALRPQQQRERLLANFVARLHHPRITDPAHRNSVLSLLYLAKPVIPYEYSKRLYGDEHASLGAWLRHVTNVATGPTEAIRFAWQMLRDRKLAERKFPSVIIRSKANLFSLDFHSEQLPNSLSRVSLGDERDAAGLPRIHVDWRYSPADVASVSHTLALLADELQRTGCGRFDYDPESVEQEMVRYGAYGGHHIGTVRMGLDPRSSAVNPDGRIHELRNLYVCGSAVFPTSSQANPTLTIVALALRLAEHLKTQLSS